MKMRTSLLWKLTVGALAALALCVVGCASDESSPASGGGDTAQSSELGSIEGTITALVDGAAVVGATVATEPATATATTGADGAYVLADLEPGTYAVVVTMDGFKEKLRQDVTVQAGAATTVDLAMEAAEDVTPPATKGSIAGTVKDEAGAPLLGATVVTEPVTETVSTAADGSYTFEEVEPGTYSVVVSAAGYAGATVTGVVVVAGETVTADATLSAEVLVGAARIDVTNLCTGEGLADATVKSEAGAEVATDAGGEVLMSDLAPGDYTFTVTATGFLPGTATVNVTAANEVTATVELECQRVAVANVARAFLLTVTDGFSVNTSAQALFDAINDGDDANDPVVVSVRSADHYAIGHVPGAVNIPWKTVASDEALAILGDPADGALHAVYCYTGHTGGIATAVLNLLGYASQNMKFGIMSWTKDADVRAIPPFSEDTDAHDFPVETTLNDATGDFEPPVLAFEGVEDAQQATRAAAQAYLAREGMKPTIAAQDVFDLLNDGDASNDPVIVSVRKAEHYALGHLPGAINIAYTDIALEENLRKLPTDRKIVVYCYTGHTGAVATAVLGVLGYDASNLKFGIGSWTKDPDIRFAAAFSEDADAHEFPVTAGATP